jgi:uncharacterized small protein (DUF1192 family)
MAEITFTDGVPVSGITAAAPNWAYAGWRRESGFTAQRDMLILHMEEIEQRIVESTSGGNQSVSTDTLSNRIQYLQSELQKLERAIGGTLYGGGTMHAAFNRGG